MVRRPKFSFGTKKKFIGRRLQRGDRLAKVQDAALRGLAGIDTRIFKERFQAKLGGITKTEIREAGNKLIKDFGKPARRQIESANRRQRRRSGSISVDRPTLQQKAFEQRRERDTAKRIATAIKVPLDKSVNLKGQGFTPGQISLINRERSKRVQAEKKVKVKIKQPPIRKPIIIKPELLTKKQQLIDKIKVTVPLNVSQQLQQRQTTTQEIKNILAVETKQAGLPGIKFDLRGKEKIKRALKGEVLFFSPLGFSVRKKDGSTRALTKKELLELAPKTSITLNPANFVTGFFGLAADTGQFIALPNKKQKIKSGVSNVLANPDKAIEGLITQAVSNPFGFAGELSAAGRIQKAVTSPFRAVKTFKLKDKSNLNTEIKVLEGQGVKVIDRTPQGRQLRNLIDQKKIVDADLLDLDKAINKASSPAKSESSLKKKIEDIKELGTKVRTRQKKRKGLKLKAETIAKGIKEISKVSKPPVIQVRLIKALPVSEASLIRLLFDARKVSGQAFSQLKKKIKKERGLNVIVRVKSRGRLQIKLLEPKKQKKKGVETKRKPEKVFLVTDKSIIRIDVKKGVRPKKEVERKLTRKQLKQREFEEGQKIERLAQNEKKFLSEVEDLQSFRTAFSNKKGQFRITQSYRKRVSKTKKQSTKIKQDKQRYINNVQRHNRNTKRKDLSLQDVKRLNKQRVALKKARRQLDVSVSKLKQAQAIALKLGSILLKLGLTLTANISASATASANAQAFKELFKDVQENINDNAYKKVNPEPVPSPKAPKATPTVKPIPRKKPTPKITPAKFPKPKKPVKKKPAKKPKPRRLRIPNFESLPRSGSRQGYLVRIKEGNKIIAQTEQLLPRKRAINFKRNHLDNTPQASGDIVPRGKTSITDVKKTILGKKFRRKRGKNPKVLISVEKRKFRIDTPGEKRGLKAAKRKKPKKKRTRKSTRKKK